MNTSSHMSAVGEPSSRAASAEKLPATASTLTPVSFNLNSLQWAVAAWFAVAMAGQLVFAGYVTKLYGASAFAGRFEQWNSATPRGWRSDDVSGNIVFGSHVLFTVVIVFGGLTQLLPVLRRYSPLLHRWNGRLYMLAATTLALGGIAMILTRGAFGGGVQQLGTSVNGFAILICAGFTWRYATKRDFTHHRRWALRLFLCVSGVFFFRIGFMAWLGVFQAPVGFDPKTFSGPFLTALSFGQFLLPLMVLELVFRAQSDTRSAIRTPTTLLVLALTVVTAFGIVMATIGMWMPSI